MKKKIIIIASAAVVVIAALLVVIFSTQSAKKCEKWIENSAKKLTYVQTVFEVTDKEEKLDTKTPNSAPQSYGVY